MKKIVVKNKDLKYSLAKARDLKKKIMSRFLFDNTFYSTLMFNVLTTTSSIINNTRNACNLMIHK